MAFIIHAFPIPQIPAGLQRSGVVPVVMRQGAEVLGVLTGDSAFLIARGDAAAAPATFNFVVVRSDVPLTAEEAVAPWVGSVTGYRTAEAGLEIYHVLRMP
jgi:hypothetical protein